MKAKTKTKRTIMMVFTIVGMAALVSSTARAGQADWASSGFMEDYSLLQPATGEKPDLIYLPSGVEKKLSGYTKIMIDQPEILLAADSPHKGMKPDQAKALADGFRETLRESFAKEYTVVEEPGKGVLYLRLGLTDLFLKRKVKFYNYTPIGAIGLGIKTAALDNIAKKFSLIEVAVEAELYDSKTKELLAASVTYMGQAKDKMAGLKKDPTSWKELKAFLAHAADRLHCRLANSRLPEADRQDCYASLDEKGKG